MLARTDDILLVGTGLMAMDVPAVLERRAQSKGIEYIKGTSLWSSRPSKGICLE
jgi:hypothetical protein